MSSSRSGRGGGKAAHHSDESANLFQFRTTAPGEHIQRRFREQCHPILIGKGGHGCCSGNSLRHISRQASEKGAWEIRGLTDCSSSVHPSRDKKLRDATFRKKSLTRTLSACVRQKQRALVLLISFFGSGKPKKTGGENSETSQTRPIG